ncbi:MAG: hypothetical protein WBQ72_01835 [Terriglobales bacterium]|jgi:hypothetical protein
MKRTSIYLLLCGVLLCTVAWAESGVMENKYGTILISDAGIVSHGSQLFFCNGLMAEKGNSLGSVSFAVGPLLNGSIRSGGTFSADGSSLTITGLCKKKDEPRGVVFIGSFEGDVTWSLVNVVGQELTFSLSGTVKGTNRRGKKVRAAVVQTIVTTIDQLAQSVGHIKAGIVMFGT